MEQDMTKAQAEAYMQRWTLVDAVEWEELRNTPIEVKYKQLASLMASVKALGWERERAEQEAKVRERWLQLRAFYAE